MTTSVHGFRDAWLQDTAGLAAAWQASVREGAVQLRISNDDAAAQASALIARIEQGLRASDSLDLAESAWDATRAYLEELSRVRVRQGLTSSETATFVLSLKRPLFELLRRYFSDKDQLADAIWEATEFVDKLSLFTVAAFQRTREDVIVRQQQELLELSTPVVKLWDGVLALPMIGTLDSARTQIVMESLLQTIADTGSEVAVLDITGVPTVDTLVAQHLLKTVTAIRLMGAECIISGVRPQIAQTIVHLGIDLTGVQTKATLADALRTALDRIGVRLVRDGAAR